MSIGTVALVLGAFGLGFGLTVTPRSTAAVESAGRRLVRDGLRDRDGRPDDRDGDRRRGPHGLRLDDDRPPLRPALLGRQPRRLEGRDPGRAPRPAAARRRSSSTPSRTWAANEASAILVGMFLAAGSRDDHRDPARPRPRRRTRRLTAGADRDRAPAAAAGGMEAATDSMAKTSSSRRSRSEPARRSAASSGTALTPSPARVRTPPDASRPIGAREARRRPDHLVPRRQARPNRPTLATSELLADPDDEHLDRSRRARREPGQGGGRGPRPPPAHRRGHRRAEPALEGRVRSTDVVHVVLFALHYDGDEAARAEIDFVLGDRLPADRPRRHAGRVDHRSAPVRRRARPDKGPDYLFYAIADTIVDGYFPVLDRDRRRHRRAPGQGDESARATRSSACSL